MRKKIIALLIAMLMVITLVPMTVFADTLETTSFTEAGGTVELSGHKPFSVTYEFPDGTDIAVSTVAFNGTANPPGNPSLSGHDFIGWSMGTDGKNGIITKVKGDITVVAQFKVREYEVSFISGGGSPTPVKQIVLDGGKATKPTDPEKTGFAFAGWYYNNNLWDFENNKVTQNITLCAGWTVLHKVTFDSKGGTPVGSQDVINGGKVTKPADPLYPGHEFKFWYYKWNGEHIYDFSSPVHFSFTLYAKWKLIDYSVTYDANGATGGSVPSGGTGYHIGEDVRVQGVGNLEKTGHTFGGWSWNGAAYQENSTVEIGTEDVVLTAIWEPIDYSVKYHANGATSGTAPADATYHIYNEVIVAGGGDLAIDGYDFIGWNTKEDGSGTSYQGGNTFEMGTSDVDLYAQWEIRTFKVEFFEKDGTTLIETKTVPWNTEAGAPSASDITGYIFEEWVLTGTNGDETDSLTNVKEDIKAVASYKPISYTVTYDKNGGDGDAMGGSTHIYDVPKELTKNDYSKAGHDFAGWAESKDASVAEYEDEDDVLNLTDENGKIVPLYAVWAIKQFDVTFYKQDGTTVIEQQKVDWNAAAKTVEAPSIPGYAFDKWILKGYDDTESTSLVHVKEKIDAVASYIKNGYTVTFLDYNGTVLGTDGVLYGEGATAPEEMPAREGYTFVGWDKAFNKVTGNLTVTAQYEINTYTVKFVDFDGRELKSQSVNWNASATAPANPAFTGFTFTGWDKAFDKVTSDLTVTAQYAINKYTVKFVDFDGKELSVQTVNWNTAATAPTSPTFMGYTFTGWDKAFDKVTSDLTVTAQYAINKYTVKFVDYDGKELSVQSVNWSTAATAPTNPTRTGYTFSGWDKAFNSITSDLTVTAQYKQNAIIDDEGVPKTYDDTQAFPWWWIVAAAGLIGAIVWIIVSQMKKHKHSGDAV